MVMKWRGGWQSHLSFLKKGQRAKVCCGPTAAPNGSRGKKSQVLLFLTSLFLLSCSSLGRVWVRNKEKKNNRKIQACANSWEQAVKPFVFWQGGRNWIPTKSGKVDCCQVMQPVTVDVKSVRRTWVLCLWFRVSQGVGEKAKHAVLSRRKGRIMYLFQNSSPHS